MLVKIIANIFALVQKRLYNVAMRAIDKFLEYYGNSQTKAADAIGVSQQNIWWWKNKSKDIPLEYIPRVSKAIGVPKKELMPDIFD